MKKLQAYVKHELAELTADKIIVSPKGKIFVRAVAMQFDRYLRESDRAGGYSKIACRRKMWIWACSSFLFRVVKLSLKKEDGPFSDAFLTEMISCRSFYR